MIDQSASSKSAAPAYSWKCLACDSGNRKATTLCSTCGCPSHATLHEIERFRPVDERTVQEVQQQDATHQDAAREALASSRYRHWYGASIGVFILSLLVSNGTGLYMLIMGWAALQYSLAWFANPLLISAFVLGRPAANPGSWRWLVYAALAMMFIQPSGSFARFWPLPMFPWLASAVLLLIGTEIYRARYRQAFSNGIRTENSSGGRMSA
jgi:hypothetical protein